METNKPSILLSLRILYFGMLIGMLLFSGVTYFINLHAEPLITEIKVKENLFLVVLAIAAICVTIASGLLQKDAKKISLLSDAHVKLERYRAAAIRTYALLEVPALLAIFGYFLILEPRLYIIVFIIVLRYVVEYPSAKKIAERIGEPEDLVRSL